MKGKPTKDIGQRAGMMGFLFFVPGRHIAHPDGASLEHNLVLQSRGRNLRYAGGHKRPLMPQNKRNENETPSKQPPNRFSLPPSILVHK